MPEGGYSYSRAADGARESWIAAEPRPPALGTKWGESRRSEVRDSSFRRSSSSPKGTIAVYYNNQANSGTGRRLSQPVSFANGTASIAIKGRGGFGGYLSGCRTAGGVHVVGKEGQRYSIEVRNHTAYPVEVVLSVDGLDVIDGRSASYGKRGYIVRPHGKVTVDGFRKSHREVAAFRFSSLPKSYAARKHGDTRNVGVIGAAVFTEKRTSPGRANPFPGEGRFASPPLR